MKKCIVLLLAWVALCLFALPRTTEHNSTSKEVSATYDQSPKSELAQKAKAFNTWP